MMDIYDHQGLVPLLVSNGFKPITYKIQPYDLVEIILNERSFRFFASYGIEDPDDLRITLTQSLLDKILLLHSLNVPTKELIQILKEDN